MGGSSSSLVLALFTDHTYWIGLADKDNDGEFEWMDGIPVTFTKWAKHQPGLASTIPACVTVTNEVE